jgi:hypothetical protein
MGSIIYDFLNDSLLFDTALLEENYASVSEARLKIELQRYRKYCIDNVSNLMNEAHAGPNKLQLFTGKSFQRFELLKQAAFYLDAVILPDPLFPLTKAKESHHAVMNEFLGMPKPAALSKDELARVSRFMLQVRPMVASNYIRFFPISYYSEPPEELPIRYSPTQFAELLPRPILDQYTEAVRVNSLRQSDTGWRVEENLRIGRGIAIGFEGDPSRWMDMYHYVTPTTISANDETRIVRFAMTLPEEPPSEAEFNAWVTQSINQSAHRHFDALSTELTLSARCGAMYLTNSPFSAEILDVHTESTQNVKTETTRFLINLDLPYFQDASVEDLMYARTSDGESFDLFRRELEKQAREIRSETDPDKLKIKTENAMHELCEVQATKVAQTIGRMRRQLASDTAIAAASFAGSVVTSGWTVLSGILAAAHGYKSFSEYQKTVRENPSYFLWKAKGK